MKRALVKLAGFLLIFILITACKANTPAAPATPATTNLPSSSTSVSPSTLPFTPVQSLSPSPSANIAQYGGIFRVIVGSGPRVLGGFDVGAADYIFLTPCLQRLVDIHPGLKQGASLEPVLAEKVEEDLVNKRYIFHLRPGVKFHDGTDFNADAVLRIFQRFQESGHLGYPDIWDGIQKLDDMTVQIKYKEYRIDLLTVWGGLAITSPTAYEKGSGGDPEKGKEWESTHCVGTGPFILKEYERDVRMTWVKNPNYWQKGKPYLDGIEFRIIPDPMTSDLLMRTSAADYWVDVPGDPALYTATKQDFQVVSYSAGIIAGIWPNTAGAQSKWNDARLRQALEYAIDKPTLAKAMGPNFFVPLTMLAPSGEWGYDPDYQARNYNPQKARDLIKEAGYSSPLEAQLLVVNGAIEMAAATALKQYLDAAGFLIDLDVADAGRYWGTLYGSPGPDLALSWIALSYDNFLMTYKAWLSTSSYFKYSYQGYTAEQQAMDEEAIRTPSLAGQKAMAEKIVRYLTDEARIIPTTWFASASIAAPYVHPAPFLGTRWYTEDIWMDKH